MRAKRHLHLIALLGYLSLISCGDKKDANPVAADAPPVVDDTPAVTATVDHIATLVPGNNGVLSIRGVLIADQYAYAVCRSHNDTTDTESGGLLVYRLDDLTQAQSYQGNISPTFYLHLGDNNTAASIARRDDILYVGGQGTLWMVDIANREKPEILNTVAQSTMTSITIKDHS